MDEDREDEAAMAAVELEGAGPFLYPRSRLVSVSVTEEDVILRLATVDEQAVELPIAIGSLPDLAMGVAAALKALRPANDDEPG